MFAHSMADTEEIAERGPNAGVRFAVPVHFQYQFAQKLRCLAERRQPNMFNTAAAFNVAQRGGLARFHTDEVPVGAGSVIA